MDDMAQLNQDSTYPNDPLFQSFRIVIDQKLRDEKDIAIYRCCF